MYSRSMQVHEPDLVDINPSGTRKEELLLSPDEAVILFQA